MNGTATGSILGFQGGVLAALCERLHFRAVSTFSVDGKWGGLNADGATWNGLVGMLTRGEADMVAAPLSLTMARQEVIDYARTFGAGVKTFSQLVPDQVAVNLDLFAYVEILPTTFWILLLASVLLVSSALSAIQKLGLEEGGATFVRNVTLCLVYLLQSDSGDVGVRSSSAPSKVLLLTTGLVMYLTYAIYTSDLTALMTFNPPSDYVKSFADAYLRGYRVITLADSSMSRDMANSAEGTDVYKVYHERMLPDPTALVADKTVAKEQLLADEKTLYFGDSMVFADDPRVVVTQ